MATTEYANSRGKMPTSSMVPFPPRNLQSPSGTLMMLDLPPCTDIYSECGRACPDYGASAHLTICLQPHIINPFCILGRQVHLSMLIPFASIMSEHQGGFTVTH